MVYTLILIFNDDAKGAQAGCMHIHIHSLCVHCTHTTHTSNIYSRDAHTFNLRLMNFSQLLLLVVVMGMVVLRTSTKANSFEASTRSLKPANTYSHGKSGSARERKRERGGARRNEKHIQSKGRKSGNSLNLPFHAIKSKCSNEKMSTSMLKIYYK